RRDCRLGMNDSRSIVAGAGAQRSPGRSGRSQTGAAKRLQTGRRALANTPRSQPTGASLFAVNDVQETSQAHEGRSSSAARLTAPAKGGHLSFVILHPARPQLAGVALCTGISAVSSGACGTGEEK